jgi:hypothetical protein
MTVLSVSVLVGLIVGILLSLWLGERIGEWRWARVPEDARIVSPALQGAIFGLMALLITFVFYGAGNRFEDRRHLMVQEANAIGTAYLRLDLLQSEDQPDLRQDFRAYVRSRLDVLKNIPNDRALKDALDRSAILQGTIWWKAVAATRKMGPATQTMVLSSINQVIDITTDQTVALTAHPPIAVFGLLAVTVLASSILAGYSMAALRERDWIFVGLYAAVLGVALYVIADYEFPRVGFVRIDYVDQVLMKTLAQMK